jgi:hypothetical protein
MVDQENGFSCRLTKAIQKITFSITNQAGATAQV